MHRFFSQVYRTRPTGRPRGCPGRQRECPFMATPILQILGQIRRGLDRPHRNVLLTLLGSTTTLMTSITRISTNHLSTLLRLHPEESNFMHPSRHQRTTSGPARTDLYSRPLAGRGSTHKAAETHPPPSSSLDPLDHIPPQDHLVRPFAYDDSPIRRNKSSDATPARRGLHSPSRSRTSGPNHISFLQESPVVRSIGSHIPQDQTQLLDEGVPFLVAHSHVH